MLKKFITLISFLMLTISVSFACDFCNGMLGINPYYNYRDKLMLNIMFQHSTLDALTSHESSLGKRSLSKIAHEIEGGESFYEYKTTFEFAYQHHFGSHFMMTGILPLERSQSSETNYFGIGDATVLAHYIYKPDFGLETNPYVFLVGGGIELPTGNFDRKAEDGDRLEIDHQSGSGSVDFVLNGTAMAQFNGWTLGLDLYGKINTENKYHEKLGNWFSASAAYSVDVFRNDEDMMGLIGILGLRYEFKDKDKIDDLLDNTSDFQSYYANIGFQFIYEDYRLNFSVLTPIQQDRSSSVPDEHTRFLIGTKWEF